MHVSECTIFAMHMGDLALRAFHNANEVEWTFSSADFRALSDGSHEVQFAGSRMHVPGESKVLRGAVSVRLSRSAEHGWLAESVAIAILRDDTPGADDLSVAYTCDPAQEFSPKYIGLLPSRASRIAV